MKKYYVNIILHSILVLVFFTSANSYSYSKTDSIAELIDKLQKAFINKNKKDFTNLFYIPDEKSKNEINELAKDYFDSLKYKQVYLQYDKDVANKDKISLRAIFIDDDECFIEYINLYKYEKDGDYLILKLEKKNKIPNIRRYLFNNAAIVLYKNLEFKLIDGDLSFKEAYVLREGRKSNIFFIIGSGKFILKPSVEYEKGQMKLLMKKDYFEDKVRDAVVNINIDDIGEVVKYGEMRILKQKEVNEDLIIAFKQLWNREKERQLNLSWLEEVDEEAIWAFDLDAGAIKVRMGCNKYGDLIYYYAPNLPFTVQLLKEKPYMIYAFYNPLQKDMQMLQFNFGIYYSVDKYDIDVEIDPNTSKIEGKAKLFIKSMIDNLSNLELSIGEQILIKSIMDDKFDNLIHFRSQQSRLVNIYLNEPLMKDEETIIEIDYYGMLKSAKPFQDYMQDDRSKGRTTKYTIKPIYFYEGSTYWYPQSILPQFSNGRLKITVPSDYLVLATGELKDRKEQKYFDTFIYETKVPAKHFSLMLTNKSNLKISSFDEIRLIQESDGIEKNLYEKITDVINFYEKLVGKLNLNKLDIYTHLEEYKGGYAQSGFIILINKHPLASQKVFKGNNPLNYPKYSDFYIAHEIAHLWFGHTVSFLTYQDQWISEGLAHYLATKYIEYSKGNKEYNALLNKFAESILEKEDAGPIILGQRLGLVNKDRDAYGAIVYNKTALVLDMLEKVVGEEKFNNSLKEFYKLYSYKFASTYNFIEIMQNNCKCGLWKFFYDWFYLDIIPTANIDYKFKGNKAIFNIKLKPFTIVPVPIEVLLDDGSKRRFNFIVSNLNQTFTAEFDKQLKGLNILEIYPIHIKK